MPKQGNQKEQIQGVVEHLNFSKSGEPNGAVLDTGHFVHIKPRAARALGLRVGQTLKVEGKSKTSAGGQQVIEAAKVNGADIASARPAKKAAPPKKATRKNPAKKAAPQKRRRARAGSQ